MALVQVDRLTEAQVQELHQLYQGEWWTQGRTLAETRQMLEQTGVVIALVEEESGALAGFVRVITDFVFKGLVLDVIVAPPWRGKGLGQRLLDAVVEHPRLKPVCHLELYCRPELVPFYKRWGFTTELGELRFMRRTAGGAGGFKPEGEV
jgi:GNAT superfamily N-acetyltransferase